MNPFALPADIEAVWRPLEGVETTAATGLILQASAQLRARVPSIDAQLTAEGESGPKRELAKAAVVNAVWRVLINPDRDASWGFTIDDYREDHKRDASITAGLYIDDGDLVGLLSRTSGFGTLRMGRAL